jgi:hypothetical protein
MKGSITGSFPGESELISPSLYRKQGVIRCRAMGKNLGFDMTYST